MNNKETKSDINLKNNNLNNLKPNEYLNKRNQYENDDFSITEDSDENLDRILEEIRRNMIKREDTLYARSGDVRSDFERDYTSSVYVFIHVNGLSVF